jgi:predicted nucleic acid-binding protein
MSITPRERRAGEANLTDCISFSAMAHAGAIDALTADHHFEQAGFTALLRHEPSV